VTAFLYDGLDDDELKRRTGSNEVLLLDSVGSVLDVVHQRATAGAASGLLVVSDTQTAGRGRSGRPWHSPRGAGVWLAALLRPEARPFTGALSVRVGLALADAIDALLPAASPRLKWPNDVLVEGRKAAGVLCEARWTGASQGWVAVGVGVNVAGPVADEVRGTAIALAEVDGRVTRVALLEALMPKIWALAVRPSGLDEGEREAVLGRLWIEPGSDAPVGVDGDGALLFRAPDGSLGRRVMPA
jgi:BirA family biotin operon repressor/biotin-[acetyl-CoA-carboxylase] ligase